MRTQAPFSRLSAQHSAAPASKPHAAPLRNGDGDDDDDNNNDDDDDEMTTTKKKHDNDDDDDYYYYDDDVDVDVDVWP